MIASVVWRYRSAPTEDVAGGLIHREAVDLEVADIAGRTSTRPSAKWLDRARKLRLPPRCGPPGGGGIRR